MHKRKEDYPLALSVEDVAEILAVGKKNAYLLMQSDEFKVLRIGRQYRVSREIFFDWLEGREDVA